jgi:hypothetical protein
MEPAQLARRVRPSRRICAKRNEIQKLRTISDSRATERPHYSQRQYLWDGLTSLDQFQYFLITRMAAEHVEVGVVLNPLANLWTGTRERTFQ